MKTISLVLKRVRKGVRTDINTGAVGGVVAPSADPAKCTATIGFGTVKTCIAMKLK